MAVAEARAVWQRTVNRCFVQEDAKRAPKLACCQSSSSISSQIDVGPSSTADTPDQPPVAFMPFNRNPSYSNPPSDTRWWLHLQPSYGYQKGLASEQLSTMDTEADHNPEFCSRGIAQCVKKDSEVEKAGMKALHRKTFQEHMCKDMKEQSDTAGMDHDKFTSSKHIDDLCFHSEGSWIVCEKTEPWWRTTDRNELASFVAQKSLDCIENCDLPPPQKHVKRDPSPCIGCFDSNETWPCSLDRKCLTHGISCPTVSSPATGSTYGRGMQFTSIEENNLPTYSDKSFSPGTTYKGTTDPQKAFESDPSKAQLLEALCHSQTRAREAENAAKQAYAETERIIKLFFREASQLFAYKQWVNLLQLEALYARKKDDDEKISNHCPEDLPQMPYGAKKLEESQPKAAANGEQGKDRCPMHDITSYAVAFAFGLSLVGAGLLLGWTVGWMLRSI